MKAPFWTLRRVLLSFAVPVGLLVSGFLLGPLFVANPGAGIPQTGLLTAVITGFSLLLVYLLVLAVLRMRRELRTGRIGSRFQARLLMGFLVVLLIAILPLYFVLGGLVQRSFDFWTMPDLGAALSDSYEWMKQEDEKLKMRLARLADGFPEAVSDLRFWSEGHPDLVLAGVVQPSGIVALYTRPGTPSDLVTSAQLSEYSLDRDFFIRKEQAGQVYQVGLFRRSAAGKERAAVIVLASRLDAASYNRALRIEKAWLLYSQMDILKAPFHRILFLSMLGFLLLVLFLSLLFSIILSRQIARPVILLYEGMHNIATGRLDSFLAYNRKDEMQSLIQAFNNMVKELAFNQKAVLHSRHIEAWKKVASLRIEEARRRLADFGRAYGKIDERILQQEESLNKDAADLRESWQALEKALLQLETLSAGPALSLRKEDLNEIVRDVMEMFQGVRQDVSFYVELDNSIPLLNINRSQVHQALVNLVKNGVEAIPSGGRMQGQIRILTLMDRRLGGNVVRLDVADNGPGVPMEEVEKVFEPFYTTKKDKQGLGLTIVRRIMEEHGGRVQYRRADGRSVFSLEWAV